MAGVAVVTDSQGSSPSQERTRTGLENRLSMLPARSRPADAPVKATALYRARVGSVGVATPCAGPRPQPMEGGEPLLDRGIAGYADPPSGGFCYFGFWVSRPRVTGAVRAGHPRTA